MSAKDVKFGEDARSLMMRGVNTPGRFGQNYFGPQRP